MNRTRPTMRMRARAGEPAQLRIVACRGDERVAQVLAGCAEHRVVRHQLARRLGMASCHELVVALHPRLDAEHRRRDGALRGGHVQLSAEHGADALHIGPGAQHRDERIGAANRRFRIERKRPLGRQPELESLREQE